MGIRKYSTGAQPTCEAACRSAPICTSMSTTVRLHARSTTATRQQNHRQAAMKVYRTSNQSYSHFNHGPSPQQAAASLGQQHTITNLSREHSNGEQGHVCHENICKTRSDHDVKATSCLKLEASQTEDHLTNARIMQARFGDSPYYASVITSSAWSIFDAPREASSR